MQVTSRDKDCQLKCRPVLDSVKSVRVVGATSSEGFCSILALSFVLARHLQTNLCYSFSGVVKSSPVIVFVNFVIKLENVNFYCCHDYSKVK